MEEFLKRCFYHTGQYDSQEHFVTLDKKLKEHEVLDVYPLLIYFFIIPLATTLHHCFLKARQVIGIT